MSHRRTSRGFRRRPTRRDAVPGQVFEQVRGPFGTPPRRDLALYDGPRPRCIAVRRAADGRPCAAVRPRVAVWGDRTDTPRRAIRAATSALSSDRPSGQDRYAVGGASWTAAKAALVTNTSTCGISSSNGMKRSMRELPGSGPSNAGSAPPVTATTSRSSPANPASAGRIRWSASVAMVPWLTRITGRPFS